MHIKQAIEQQVDIICATIEERNKCVEILERERHSNRSKTKNEGLIILINSNGSYATIVEDSDGIYDVFPKIPAADFIASNTILEAPSYTPAEIEYMDKVAIAYVNGITANAGSYATPSILAVESYEFAISMLEQKRLLTEKIK